MRIFLILLIACQCSFAQRISRHIKQVNNLKVDGYTWLVANARVFHDFSLLTGNHGSTISLSDDLTANNRDLVNNPSGYTALAPTVFRHTFQNLHTEKTHYATTNNPLLFATNSTNAIFSTSHEIHISLSAKTKNFILYPFGVNSTQVHYTAIETDGKVSMYIKRSTNTTRIRSVNPVFTQAVQNGDIGNVIALRFRYNFSAGAEECKMYINNTEIATELVSGDAPSSWSSGYTWNNIYSFAIGAYAQAANTIGSIKPYWIHQFTVTPLLTQDQSNLVTHQILRTANQAGKLIFLGDERSPICTDNKTYYCSVYLSSQPADNVTVSVSSSSDLNITGSSLTFTPSNFNVPQVVKFVATDSYGYRPVTVTFTASGGFVETKNRRVICAESKLGVSGKDGSDVYLTDGWNAARIEANSIAIPSATSLRNSIKSTLFKGAYPSGSPEATTTPTSYGGVTLANASAGAKNRYTFTLTDGGGYLYTSYVAHVRNTSPNNKLFIQLFGHGESFHQELYNSIIALGYDWAGACLAFAVENVENNPNLTGSPSWLAHDQLFTGGVDTPTFDARSVFFHDKIRFLDYILTQYAYSEVVVAGASGGGWTATMWASYDLRVNKVFNVRGCNSYNHPESGSDFEQGPNFLAEFTGGAKASIGVYGPRVIDDYRQLGYLKRMALICANGAEYHHISHELDPLGGGNYIEMALDILQLKTAGKYFQFVNRNAAQSTHGFNADERAYIVSRL